MKEELKKTKAELDIYEVACELVLNELEKQEMITQSTKIKKEFLKIDPVYDNIYNGKIINKLLKIIQKDMKKHKKRIDKFFIVDLSFILEEKIKNYNLLNYQQVDKITSKELIKKFDVDADKDFFIFLKKLIWEYYLLTERKYSIEQDIKNHESKNNKKESLINYRKEIKEKEKMKELSAYRMVAKQALKEWNGLSDKEAEEKVQTESVDELESQVYAKSSMNSALYYIEDYIRQADLPLQEIQLKMEMNKMHDDVYNSNEKSKTLEIIGNIIKTESNNNTADFTIDALEAIHNTWVSDNENKFFKEGRNAEFQHMPIELIGWDEAKKDLLFLNPILQKMGISNSEQELEESYEEKQKRFNQIHDITNKETLLEEISKGKEFYNVLQPEISEELKNPMTTQKIVNQITQKNPTLLKNVPNRINSL